MHDEDSSAVNGLAQDFTTSGRPLAKSTDVSHGFDRESSVAMLTETYRSVLTAIGEDPNREGLLKTPERAAKAMIYFTKGYSENVAGNKR